MRIELIAPIETAVQRRAVDTLEAEILAAANGYSVYAGIGAWRDDSGDIIRESHRRYEIETGDREVKNIIRAFQEYGRTANESLLYFRVDGKPFFETVKR